MLEVIFILIDFIFLYHLLSKAHFFCLVAYFLFLFEKAENFVKYTVIYIIQLHFSTLLQINFCPHFFVVLPFL